MPAWVLSAGVHGQEEELLGGPVGRSDQLRGHFADFARRGQFAQPRVPTKWNRKKRPCLLRALVEKCVQIAISRLGNSPLYPARIHSRKVADLEPSAQLRGKYHPVVRWSSLKYFLATRCTSAGVIRFTASSSE